jgi:hypothetical protein
LAPPGWVRHHSSLRGAIRCVPRPPFPHGTNGTAHPRRSPYERHRTTHGPPELLTALCLIIAGIIVFRRRAASNKHTAPQPHQREALATPATPAPIRRDPRSPYEPVPILLTAAERNFFAVLRDATPGGLVVFPRCAWPAWFRSSPQPGVKRFWRAPQTEVECQRLPS